MLPLFLLIPSAQAFADVAPDDGGCGGCAAGEAFPGIFLVIGSVLCLFLLLRRTRNKN